MATVTTELPTLLACPHVLGVKDGTPKQAAPEQPLVVAMFSVGHVKPTFALVNELVVRGCRVHYFLPPSDSIRAAARQAGAVVEGYRAGDPADFDLDVGNCMAPKDKFSAWSVASTAATSEHILARCRALKVQLTVYDTMTPHGLLVAWCLGVPCVSYEVHDQFHATAVGCMKSGTAPHVASSAAMEAVALGACGLTNASPEVELAAAAARGDRVIYASMGTTAVSDRWAIDISTISGSGLPAGTTGKVYCQHLWRALFEAMRELGEGYHLVLGIGGQADALDFLDGESDEQRLERVPTNVTLRKTVQQVAMLSNRAHAFVTHAGSNSLRESLVAGVPMVALPQAADQSANAQLIEASGWGRTFLRPLEATPAALARALREVAAEDGAHRAAVRAAGMGGN